jgi:hypothetical protein
MQTPTIEEINEKMPPTRDGIQLILPDGDKKKTFVAKDGKWQELEGENRRAHKRFSGLEYDVEIEQQNTWADAQKHLDLPEQQSKSNSLEEKGEALKP